MKSLSLFFTLLYCYCHAFSQDVWVDYPQPNGDVKFFIQNGICGSGAQGQAMDYKFIKVENLAPQKVKVSYQLEVYYQSGCIGCDGSPEYTVEFVLNPGEAISGNCGYTLPYRLDVLVNNPNLTTPLLFTHFKITQIHVDRIE